MAWRKSDNAGSSWSDEEIKREFYCHLYGLQTTTALREITAIVVDTLGVSYRLAMRQDEESEYRGGFIALHNL
jgi:hypothetical protein